MVKRGSYKYLKHSHASSDNNVHMVAATIFTIVAFVHSLRLAFGWPLTLGTWVAPFWVSWLAVFITASLAVLLWKNLNHNA